VPQRGEHIFLEDTPDLFQAGLPSFLQREPAMGQPLLVDGHEGVLAGQDDRVPLALAFAVGIDALGEQRAGFIAKRTGVLQRERRIRAEGHAVALAAPREAEVPRLCTGG
jgi:hypothetical protein